ncbi:MAG: class I SAM-dependent methyltransferase [Hyphomonadaceae bacterium]|nr:class I SAM-dependent methyltransferase [Hyphomonadaceae bacterium]
MGLFDTTTANLGRARYAAAQGLRSAFYGAQYAVARRQSAGFNRPGEAPFRPEHGKPDPRALRRAFFRLWAQDRANIEAGLYAAPNDVRLRDLVSTLKRSQAFLRDVREVDRRRVSRSGVEVRQGPGADPERYPAYYRQNFHYQTDGWLSDDSARLYDHQVETLFTGAGDAMRRMALAEISRELKGRDQRAVRLLDLACGTGRFTAQILRTFPKLRASALDLSPNYTARARKALAPWPQVDVMEGAAEALPLEDESFDLIVSVYLFHELPVKIREKAIAEAARILKPGGLFIVADSLQFGDTEGLDPFLEYFPEGFHEPYYKQFLGWDFEPVMRATGFQPERLETAFLTKVRTWRLGA